MMFNFFTCNFQRITFSYKLVLSLISFSCITLASKAQNEVSVDNFRGIANVSIPIADFNINGYESSVSLEYSAKSVKIKNSIGELPEGWSLEAGGSISRILKGLPDEYLKAGDSRKGWMNTGIQNLPQTFSISDDNNPNTCTDENTNRTAILSNWGYTLDSEPDWFVVNAPGLNCKLILDNNNVFRAIPAQDLKIEFLDQGTANPYFVITKTNGAKYTFKTAAVVTKSIARAYTNTSLEIFNKEYEYFKTPLTYITTWYLDKVTTSDSDLSKVTYLYSQIAEGSSNSQSSVSSLSPGTGTFSNVATYITSTSGYKQQLSQIQSSASGSLIISRNPSVNEIMKFDIFSGENSSVSISLKTTSVNDNTRSFLSSITELAGGCTSTLYKFEYYGCNFSNLTSTLPVTNSEKYDAWGYFNNLLSKRQLNVFPTLSGASGIYKPYTLPGYSGENYTLNGTDAVIDEASINAGVMSKITYPTGGSSYLEYESNSFWDQDGSVEIKGNGVRIKKLTHFDGINPSKAMITEYTYNVPGQTRTSGTIKSLPQIALTTNYFANPNNSGATLTNAQVLALTPQQSANYWKYLTLISSNDVDNQSSHSVIYQYVSVKEKNNGRTENKYAIPYNLWTAESNSVVYPAMACSGAKPTGLPVKKGFMQYPFPYKENMEYAEGLLLESKMYSETNKQVQTSEYEYEDYTATPQAIYGMDFDLVYGNLLFSRYGLSVNAKVMKKEKQTIFDTGLSGNSSFTETNYDNSAPDKNIRSKTTANSDNMIVKTSYTYSSDFNITAGQISTDPFAEGIYNLNQKYMKNVVLEELEQRQEPGASVFKVYSGNLSLYKKNPATGMPVLAEIKSLSNINGLSGFLPLAFNGSSVVYNVKYRSNQIMGDFNGYDLPQSIITNRVKSGLVYVPNINVPSAVFNGADLVNVAFTNFEGTAGNMVETGFLTADYTLDAHTGLRAGILRSGNDLSRSFTKLSGSRTYNLSFWAKSATTGTINVLLNNVAAGTVAVSASSEYKFYQKHINVASIPDNSSVKVTASSSIMIDDIVFSPEEVNYQLVTYNYPAGKSSETNSSGKTLYYEYDKKGRQTYMRDADKNIVQYKSYQNYNSTAALSAGFSLSGGSISVNGQSVFVTTNGCVEGEKYTWNFGDGSTLETYDPQVSHVFTTAGSYTVTLTVFHPYLGTQTSSQIFKTQLILGTCIAGPERKDLCNKQPTTMGDCSASFPAPASGSRVYVNTISGCPPGTTYQYQWQTQVNGVWVSAGTNQNYLQIPPTEGISYVRCQVSSSFGTSSQTATVVINYYRSENCPIRED
nr:PKD domain-containing protein [Pedobacter panaciterrae]